MRTRTAPIALVCILFAGLGLHGCASGPRVITNSDPAADWGSFRTFGFFQPLGTDQGNVQTLMSRQLIESATREMEAAGFTLSDSDPDLVVNFYFSTRETIQTRPSTSASVHHSCGRYQTWSGWSASTRTTEIVQRTEGTLGVDIVDSANNQLIWEGAASQRVTDSRRANQDQELDAAITDIFTRFP